MTLDLTKITTPFGLLDAETQVKMRDAYADGKPIECFMDTGNWHPSHDPFQSNMITYRVKSESLRDIDLPWDALDSNWIAAARDEDGRVFLYDTEPLVRTSNARYWTYRGPNGTKSFQPINGLLKHDPGNKPWEQSLVFRPGYDVRNGAK